jgi:hypothetical protein
LLFPGLNTYITADNGRVPEPDDGLEMTGFVDHVPLNVHQNMRVC